MTLAESLPLEIERVQEIIGIYEQTPGGRIAAALMKNDVAKAQKAMSEGDVEAMLKVCRDLQGWSL